MEGFNWLNLPNGLQSTSPAPPSVSFGLQPTANSQSNIHENPQSNSPYKQQLALADSVLMNRPYAYSESDVNSNPTGDDNGSIPLSLTTQDLTLAESRTYIRWYSDILARTNSRTILMQDVYKFLYNFRLPEDLKDQLNKMFRKYLHSINIGEFFALLRIISHCLDGKSPNRSLLQHHAPIPTPASILSKKRQSEPDDDDDEEEVSDPLPQDNGKPLDLDSFTQFMLTGERPDEHKKKLKKKLKSVKFSDQIVTGVHESTDQNIASPNIASPPNEIDFSLPMDQLLSRMSSQQPQKKDEEEQQVLEDMGSQLNHFQNLNSVDTASIGGVPASIHLGQHEEPALLKPNMTGPAQMSQYLQQQQQQQQQPQQQPQQRSQTQEQLLQPNRTGPYDMMKMFSPSPDDLAHQQQEQYQQNSLENNAPVPSISLQSFTDQMTGNTAANTMANARAVSASSNYDRPLPAPPAPVSRRTRSLSSPTPTISHSRSPPPIPGMGGQLRPVPPPPPPSRRRGTSSAVNSPLPVPSSSPAPALPPKVIDSSVFYPPQQNQQQDSTQQSSNGLYDQQSGSTADILDDLKELQAEVDRIRDMTGGF